MYREYDFNTREDHVEEGSPKVDYVGLVDVTPSAVNAGRSTCFTVFHAYITPFDSRQQLPRYYIYI